MKQTPKKKDRSSQSLENQTYLDEQFLIEKRQERNTKVRVWSRRSKYELCVGGVSVDRGDEKRDRGEVWKGIFGKFVVYPGGSRICGEIVVGFSERERGFGEDDEREEERELRMGWGDLGK